MNKNKDVTIVVNTCDAYEDVWELFFFAFNEYWSNCNYEIVLNTESKQYVNNSIVKTHNYLHDSGQDIWGARLLSTLNDIDSEYVIMLYDDFILEEEVNTKKIEQLLEWMNDNNEISVFYFCNLSSGLKDKCKYKDFQLVSSTGDYRLNSVPAIWRRKKLIEFTSEIDTPWAWEYFGSYRTYNEEDIFYCSKKDKEDIFVYDRSMGGAIYRGKWVGKVVNPLIEKYNLNIDVNKRGLADNINQNNSRSLKWKIDFIVLGFRMIKFGLFLYLYRILKRKLKG